ncbi:hypothetical protein LR48_Vigan07g131000 [Vigna angularis]|uniref:Uncharacterized protein n=1 Tax=Phaseolus angularis TaxID=3914 RepID=A0A0L9UY33_PHAAN|nr:hypothetical protein LR48_Vigan07g131000 [Vigna angularis]
MFLIEDNLMLPPSTPGGPSCWTRDDSWMLLPVHSFIQAGQRGVISVCTPPLCWIAFIGSWLLLENEDVGRVGCILFFHPCDAAAVNRERGRVLDREEAPGRVVPSVGRDPSSF